MESLELMKIAGDQSIISGATHPIFHGFNYSLINAVISRLGDLCTFINAKKPW